MSQHVCPLYSNFVQCAELSFYIRRSRCYNCFTIIIITIIPYYYLTTFLYVGAWGGGWREREWERGGHNHAPSQVGTPLDGSDPVYASVDVTTASAFADCIGRSRSRRRSSCLNLVDLAR